jgi:HEAT repeat protein
MAADSSDARAVVVLVLAIASCRTPAPDPAALFHQRLRERCASLQPPAPHDPTLARLARRLREGAPDDRLAAVEAIGARSHEREALPILERAACDADVEVALEGVRALGRAGLAALGPLLRTAARLDLGLLGLDRERATRPHAPVPIPDHRMLPAELAEVLSRISGVGPLLVARLGGEPSATARWVMVAALGRLRAPLDEAVPALARALADREEEIIVEAAAALERLGPAALPAACALQRVERRNGERARKAASAALRALFAPGSTPSCP